MFYPGPQRRVDNAHIPTNGLQCGWCCCVLSYWLPH
uniref:Uncharacterized protein n=1 Tax=Anguilla anguilla TaxID=7936 RepID=A0A0E9XWV1_ANGAN